MTKETRIALMNYDWLMRNRDDVELCPNSDAVIYGDGGADWNVLCEPGFTPATELCL